MKKAIIIMAKVPFPGSVKTRMQPYLTGAESAQLSTAFLLDAELKVAKIDCDSIIAFSPGKEEEKLKSILQHEHLLIGQFGNDLGERMFNAFKSAFENGAESIVMIGTDSPTFPAKFIEHAFEFLGNRADVVLGETEDGGFYLIGFREFVRDIFGGVEWSTKKAFGQTVRNIEKLSLKLKKLPIWYDVDHSVDLAKLRTELKNTPDAAPNSRKWLKENVKTK